MGWYLNLPGAGEQAFYGGTIINGDYFSNTTIPGSTQALTCGASTASGFTMAVSVNNGGSGLIPAYTSSSGPGYSGVGLNGVGSVSRYVAGGLSFMGTNITSNNSNSGGSNNFGSHQLNTQPGIGSRMTWTRLR
jgi:Tfp pilus tip-associated adhesin PilY1